MPVISSLRSMDIPVRTGLGVDLVWVVDFVIFEPDVRLGVCAVFAGARFFDELLVFVAGVLLLDLLGVTFDLRDFFAIYNLFSSDTPRLCVQLGL